MLHDFEALAEFFDGFRDAVEGSGQGFDVLAFERGDEHLDEFLTDGLGVSFLIAPRDGEFGERDVAVAVLQHSRQGFNALMGRLGAGREQIKKAVRFSKEAGN